MLGSEVVKQRFERDAVAFDAIYDTEKSEFSGWFNKVFRKPIFERYAITMDVLGDLKTKSVLDVGCGSGVYTVQFAAQGAAKVKGIDFSRAMLELANKRVKSKNFDSICTFQHKDFMEADTTEQFHFSVAMGVFDYLSDPVSFLKKLKAVTLEKVLISFPSPSIIRGPLRRLRYFLTGKGRVYYYTHEDIRRLVKSVGFTRADIRPMKTGSGFVLIAEI